MKRLLLIELLLAISFSLMAEGPVKKYKNPVVNYSLPDPSGIRAEDGYFTCMQQKIFVICRSIVRKIWLIGNLLVLLLLMKHVRL